MLTLGGMLAPVLAGMVLAYLMQGLVVALERLRVPAGAAVGLVFALFMGLLLVFLLAVLALGVTSIVKNAKWAKLAAAIAGIVVGLISLIVTISLMANVGDSSSNFGAFSVNASVGSGTVMLFIVSILLVAASLITVLPKTAAAQPPVQ